MREVFRAEALPVLQNRTFATADAARASATGDVVLVQDERTGLVFNAAFDPNRLVYDRDYQNEQAHSAAFQRHLDAVAGIVERHWRGRTLIEIGCGKGFFLEQLQARGFAVTGIDPAYEGTNPAIVAAPFERGQGLRADAIVLRHVLEHIPDPVSFVADIAAATGGGQIYIEVPCFDWIRARRAWFDVFYEHVNYFRLDDFDRMFGRVIDRGHLFGGQYLYVVADLATVRQPVAAAADRVDLPDDFVSGVTDAAARARDAGSRRRAVWGGSSKGVIFSLYLQRLGVEPDCVIDINRVKQGRYLPVTGLRVSSPEEALPGLRPGDQIFVMNSNYLDEIVAAAGGGHSYVTVDDAAL